MDTVSAGPVVVVPGKWRQTARGGGPLGRLGGSHAADDRSIEAGRAGRSTLALNGGSLAAQEFAERESCGRTRMNSAKA